MKLVESAVALLVIGLALLVFSDYGGAAILVLLLLAAIQQAFFRKPSTGPRKRSTYVPSSTLEAAIQQNILNTAIHRLNTSTLSITIQ